jgi:choline dehydrogenase
MKRTVGTYDYVVVGAGSAGCVMASRLTERSDRSVLVLEAGEPNDKREIDIPLALGELFRSSVDWEYYTEPQPGCAGRRLFWPRGKTLGGSSSINAMIYIRGHPADYDHWADLGNEGWGYDEMLPYFRRSEHFEPAGSKYHGLGGPLNVAEPRSPRRLSRQFVDGAAAVGHERNHDFNGERQEGVGLYHLTQKGGQRCSTADAFLKPALDRPNLRAETGAHVTGITFDGDRATGVEFRQDGVEYRARADREVVVCGGAVDSPKLLMLSGIGDPEHLAEHGIETRADLPGVGRNLQDHLFAFNVYRATEPVTLDDAENLVNLAKYLLFKRGPLTSNIAESGGFARTDAGAGGLDAPDLQFHFVPAYLMRHGFDNPEEGHGFSIGVTQLRPESRGRVTLRSDDPLASPAIDPRYLTEEPDLDVLVEGIRMAREIASQSAFDGVRGEEVWPGEGVESDEGLAEWARETVETVYHPVGTCRMGDDDMAVVDDELRVHGVEGLRVVDASVMPTIPGGNTNAPTIAVAERAADLMKRG